MAEDIRTTLQFQADITDFQSAMQEANRLVKLANSEFKAVSAGMDDWSKSTDGLTAKLRQLSTVQEAEQRKLDALKLEYAEVAKAQGENSAEAVKLQTRINNQQAVVNKTQREFEKYSAALEDVESAADGAGDDIAKAGKAAKEAGNAAKESADGWTIAKDVIADFVSNAISSAIDALVSVAEATREYRREMALLAQNAADSGNDVEAMKETLAGVSAVTGDTEAAMEGLNMLMATGLKSDNLTYAAEALAGAATRFDGVNFEGIAEGLQETLATGAAVGPFAEIIERTGGNLESFNEGLAAATAAGTEQQYVLDWLANSGLKSVHDAYVQNNADLVAAEQAQFRYNDAMAGIGAAVEPINTALSNLGATILEQITPVVQNIVNWVLENLPTVGPIIAGIATALGVLAAALGIQALINGVSKAFALLNATMLANPIVLIVALIAGLVAALVAAYKKSETFRNVVNGVWESVKNAAAAFADAVGKVLANIVKWFKNAWSGVKNAWNGAGDFFSGIWGRIRGAFSGVVSTIGGIFSSAWSAVKNAWSGVTGFFSDVWGKIKGAFSGAFSGMSSVGKNLVEGIWSGISGGYTWIKDKISGWVGNVTDFIKGLFGINSPSTVMRDEVGKMLGAGVAEGITESRGTVQKAVRGLKTAAVDGVQSGGSITGTAAAATGGNTINFYQTNNSPRALSRREIYRQTHNALAIAGG